MSGRRVRSLIVAVAVVVANVAVTTAAGATQRPATLAWGPCPEARDDAGVRCAHLRVPIDWDHPATGTVELAVARRSAGDPNRRVGTLFFDLAGPGVGVDVVLSGAAYFSEELRRRFDIVGFDTRGAGRSNPLSCTAEVIFNEPAPVNRPLTSQADFDARVAYNRRVAEDCRAHTGPLADHIDSLSSARDLEAIRAALGERRISFYAVSYGTVLGQAYAERFPDRVRAIALDSVVAQSLTTASLHLTAAANEQDSFDEFRTWSEDNALSPLHGHDVRALWTSLLDRASRGELPDPFDPSRPLTADGLIELADAAFWTADWAALATTLDQLDRGVTAPTPGRALAATDPTVSVHGAALCGDFYLPVRDYPAYARLQQRSGRAAPDMRYSPLATFWTLQCLGGPAGIPNPQHPLRVDGLATPILLANGRHDPATGYGWAGTVARQLGRDGVLLTYDGHGHTTYGRSGCIRNTIDRYLITLALPAAGTHCPAVS